MSKQDIDIEIKSIIGFEDYQYTSQPQEIKELVKRQVTSVLDELESKKVIGQRAEEPHMGEYNKWYIPYEAIQSIRSRYEQSRQTIKR